MQTKKNINKSTNKKLHKPAEVLPQGWFFMGKEKYTVENLKEALGENAYDIEIWKEAGILEIGIDEKNSMDIEACEVELGDEFSDAFLKEHGICSLFYISYRPEIHSSCKKIMQKFVMELNGIICADTEDFMPQISPIE